MLLKTERAFLESELARKHLRSFKIMPGKLEALLYEGFPGISELSDIELLDECDIMGVKYAQPGTLPEADCAS